MKTCNYKIESIDCANCAKELEEEIGKIDGVQNCHIEFGVKSRLSYQAEDDKTEKIEQEMMKIIREDQGENTIITRIDNGTKKYEYVIESIDCANCAKELEEEIGKIDGVQNCRIEFGVKSRLHFEADPKDASRIEQTMSRLIKEDQGENTKITRTDTKEKKYEYTVETIDCAACAKELEEEIGKIDGVSDCHIEFGVKSRLSFQADVTKASAIEKKMMDIIREDQGENTIITRKGEKKKAEPSEEEDDDKNMLMRIISGGILFVIGLLLKGTPQMIISLISYVILGYDVILKAVKNIGKGQLFDEHFLMTVATFAAIYLRDYQEAAGVMLFYQIGEYFEDLAVRRSRKSIGALMHIRPEFATVKRNDAYIQVDPDEVLVGETVRVKPGEKIPLDGVVISGASSLDTSSLTGESGLVDVDVNDEVISGSVNETGVLEIKTTKEYGESTVAKILDLVENNDSRKADTEKFITKFSRYYTPIVVFSAIAVAIIVGIATGNWHDGIYRACTFLVISCPCALVISIPLSFFAGIGGLSGRGVLVKGANIIETLADVKNVVMDKTGTLTTGKFAVEKVLHAENPEKTIELAAYAEHYSNHPIAEGIRNTYGKGVDESRISEVREIAGRGVEVMVEGKKVLAGNPRLLEEEGIVVKEETEPGTRVYVAEDGRYLGCLILKDQLKEDAEEAVAQLHEDNCRVMIVSGDSNAICNEVKEKIHADKVYGQCLPEDKVAHVKKIAESGITAFVGDGVNDAPVLAASDVSFAMGALGSDAAIEAADVVLMDDKPSKISLTISSAKRILRVAKENIYGAITVKIIVLILGALGIANMWLAIFADTGVAILCVLNSMRLLHIAGTSKKKQIEEMKAVS